MIINCVCLDVLYTKHNSRNIKYTLEWINKYLHILSKNLQDLLPNITQVKYNKCPMINTKYN